MRFLVLVLCFLAAGCSCFKPAATSSSERKEYTVIRETSRPARAAEVSAAPAALQPVVIQPVQVFQPQPMMYAAPMMYYPMAQQPMMQPQVQMRVTSPAAPVVRVAQPMGTMVLEPTTGEMEHCVIVLQHPEARDLVRCLNTDLTCIAAYERLGYVQLRHTPQFAGSKDVEAPSDYPARQNRVNNNIPRW